MVNVAIVGGGMGGLAAAFELVSTAPDKHAITVYERTWRLGGKGASGRSVDDKLGKRIEEHGLHILMGFYQNVFEILRTCYTDLRAAGKLPPGTGDEWWSDVLHGLDGIFFAEPPYGDEPDWTHWHVQLDPNDKPIGDPAEELPTVRKLMHMALKRFLAHVHHSDGEAIVNGTEIFADATALDVSTPEQLDERIDDGVLRDSMRRRIEAILTKAWHKVDLKDQRGHRWFVALYFAGLNLRGIITDVLPGDMEALAALDVVDYKDWIEKFNFLDLPPMYHRESAPVNAVYDLVFSRETGFAAGTALYDTLLMLLDYRGHIFYKMAGGMGDVVFAPLYLWLRDRGVKFEFFHDLTDIALSPDGTRVSSLTFDVAVRGYGSGGSSPLVDVDCTGDDGKPVTLPCWPAAPDTAGLEMEPGGKTITDFDAVVLAIPVGAIRERMPNGIPRCQALFADARFAAMANGLVTRCTRAVQLWFSVDLAELGWTPVPESPALGPVLGSYRPVEKHNSWADMTQVLPRETWVTDGPKNIAYLCDVFDEKLAGDAAAERVRDDAKQWLCKFASGLWPATALQPSPWDLLHDPENGVGEARFDRQYWRANIDGSEQYVTGAPGTTALRLDPDGTQFENLFLAGDWVRTPLNAGCVEGAAMGGRIAARRIATRMAAGPPTLMARTSVSNEDVGPFISRDGDLPLLQPVVLGDLTMHGYVMKADFGRLRAAVGDAFSPLGIHAEPLAPFVVAASVQAMQIRSQVKPDAGYMTEAELGFWVPVHLTWDGGSSAGFYLPYLFVDNAAALLAGREIYGFNKILGLFSYRSPGDIDAIDVKAQVLHEYAPATRLDWQTVASVSFEPQAKSTDWTSSQAIKWHLARKLLEKIPEVDKMLASPSLPVFFLKQFRSAASGDRASLSHALTAHVTLEPGTVSGGWLDHDAAELRFQGHATLDVAGTLGLDNPSQPWLAFWAKCTAVVQNGLRIGGGDGVG